MREVRTEHNRREGDDSVLPWSKGDALWRRHQTHGDGHVESRREQDRRWGGLLEALKERVELGRYGGGVAGTDPTCQDAVVWGGKDGFCYYENADVLRERGSQPRGAAILLSICPLRVERLPNGSRLSCGATPKRSQT